MDVWPQRELFRKTLEEFQGRTGKTHAEIASILGLAKSSFRGILYSKNVRPSLSVLEKASALFDTSIKKFITDPRAAPFDGLDVIPVPRFDLRLDRAQGDASGRTVANLDGIVYVDMARIRKMGVNPMGLCYFDIEDDSMEPNFYCNDRLLVDLTALSTGFKAGVWMVQAGSAVMVKRVQLVGADQYQASSDNTVYSSFFLGERCQLLGRIISLERVRYF
ncbi:MAG: hypothetical protein FWG12_06805 [Holophagaceae bacterium]|nr:hypothetical protein [Holophagaceae bacterium]